MVDRPIFGNQLLSSIPLYHIISDFASLFSSFSKNSEKLGIRSYVDEKCIICYNIDKSNKYSSGDTYAEDLTKNME